MYSSTPGSSEHLTTSLNADWDDPYASLCGLSGPSYPETTSSTSLNRLVLPASEVEGMDEMYQDCLTKVATAVGKPAVASHVFVEQRPAA